MNKLIFPILLALMLVSCATENTIRAGKINGTNIPNDEFLKAFRGHYTNFSFQQGRMPDMNEKQQIFKETWRNITKYVILQDYYKKYKINVTTKEAIDTLISSIPSHILNSPRFQVNGNFDKSIYTQSLLTDQPVNLAPLRKHYHENVIPITKLQSELVAHELISKSTAIRINKILSSKATIEMNIFDPAKLEVHVSDEEIATNYQANLPDFRLEAYHRLGISVIPVTPDDDDVQYSKAVADSVLYQLRSGYTAEEVVHSRKNNPGLVQLIDHGFAKNSDIPPAVSELLANLKDGSCSDTILDDRNWVIHQKIQSTKTLTMYRSVYVISSPGSTTLAEPEAKALRMVNLASTIGLAKAADEFSLTFTAGEQESPDSLSWVPSDVRGKVKKALRKALKRDILGPYLSMEASGLVIIEVLDNQTKEYMSLEEVSSRIRKELEHKAQNQANLKQARLWIESSTTKSESNTETRQNTTNHNVTELKNIDIYSIWEGTPITNLYYQTVNNYLNKTPSPILESKGLLIVPIVKEMVFANQKNSPQEIREVFVKTLPPDWFDD
ncbi:MAG: peptidylprolyl isomerase, partial [Candidatus Cloacimonetes bacterium]|nr:peptidylprolyl isomerase [Candidatus Cloacimonadota bacterium]